LSEKGGVWLSFSYGKEKREKGEIGSERKQRKGENAAAISMSIQMSRDRFP